MRRSKKTEIVQNFKIRRCVVRLQRMKPQQMKMTRSTANPRVAISTPTMKKRTITVTSTPTSLMKAKERLKTPIVQRQAKIVQTKKLPLQVQEELPPTIAAGRSRRAHKPNPKYASEDMVTPRSLKARRDDGDGKQRRTSTSSMDDFFNKDTTDEDFEDLDDEDTEEDKKLKLSKRFIYDSDFADAAEDSDMSIPQKKKPGRPRKHKIEPPPPQPQAQPQRRATISTPNILNKSAPNAKNTSNMKTPQTQLQQLRRTLEANTVSPLAMGRKRKLEESGNAALPVTAKRFLLNPGANKLTSSGMAARRNSPTPAMLSGNKSVGKPIAVNSQNQKREGIMNSVQERRTLPTKPLPTILNSKSLSATKLQQMQERKTSSTIAAAAAIAKANSAKSTPQTNKQNSAQGALNQRSATTTTVKTKSAENTKERSLKILTEDLKDTGVDDFETMPTFTIVNINDIINKKGDVLISKKILNKRPSSTASSLKPSKVLANKTSPDGLKNSQKFCTSTPLRKISTEKNVHNASNKLQTLPTSSGGDKKPPPLILNSVVGRKTKPVKPMIANLNISEDNPSSSVNLFDDDEDDDDDLDDDSQIGGSSSNETELLEPRKSVSSKSYTSLTPMSKNKGSEQKPATKENSRTASNLQSALKQQQETRKLSPEKVVVSRQGDKIIKKITCFETWYVINVPPDAPEEYERNALNMPLITLANAAETINLPSSMWTTKVTLYELSALTLAKSKIVMYTGDLKEQNVPEEDRYRYQPSCVMFRRSVADRIKSQLPYDRAVIFKNKTFFTNIEGKNVKLVGAPSSINHVSEIEILLHIVDSLTLQSSLVEPATTI